MCGLVFLGILLYWTAYNFVTKIRKVDVFILIGIAVPNFDAM